MNKELIIQMAREAGGLPDPMVFIGAYERFFQLATEWEREACAKVCDELGEKGYVAEGCATAIREALAEQPAQQQEIDELTAQRDKLADILTRTANALKGQPAELSVHSWHDLPEVAQQLKAAQQQEPVAWMYRCSADSSGPVLMQHKRDWAESGSGLWTETPLYTSPPASKPWVGLTEEDIEAAMPGGIYDCLADPWDCGVGDGDYMRSIKKDVVRIVRAIEAKLKERNT